MAVPRVLRCLSMESIVFCWNCTNVVECGLFNLADILKYFIELLLGRNLAGPSEKFLNCCAKLFLNIACEVLSAIIVFDCPINN